MFTFEETSSILIVDEVIVQTEKVKELLRDYRVKRHIEVIPSGIRKRAKEIVYRFSTHVFASEILDVYEEVLSRRELQYG